MYTIIERYYTPIDRFINKLRRKGFWLYTGLITVSFVYVIFSISNLPSLPPPPPSSSPTSKRKKDKMVSKSTKERIENEDEVELGPSDPVVPLEQTHSNDHIINSWSKRQLYQFLFEEKIYPDVDEELNTIKKQVIEIYEFKKQHGTLDKKYI